MNILYPEKDLVTLGAIQMASLPGDKEANLEKARTLICQAAAQGAKIACLPELFLTGYSLEKKDFLELGELPSGPMGETMRVLSAELDMAIIAPFPERDESRNNLWNAALVVCRGEILGVHRKIYLWGEKEKNIFLPGENLRTFATPWGTLGVLICADAEYPEPSRILALKGANILLVPSVWSIQAKKRWDIFLPAEALGNLCYLVGVNTIGGGVRGGNCGHSKIIDPYGRILREASESEEIILLENVDFSILQKAREELPYLRDFRRETYRENFSKPGKNCRRF